MLNILIVLIIISTISNVIVYDIPFKFQRYTSIYKYIDLILYVFWKVLNCVNCLSYHLTWLYFLLIQGDLNGFFYGFGSYLLASVVDKILHSTSI